MENGKESAFCAMNEQEVIYGLTKREYFATMAMQGLMRSDRTIEWITNRAVECADELLKRLENKED